MISRRGFVAGLMAGASTLSPVWAEAPATSVRPVRRPGPMATRVTDAARLIDAAGLGGVVSYAVMDAATGALLDARLADTPLPPASVAKAITALYANDRLGTGFRFATQVLATGPVAGGIVQGDLVLAGSGDPTLHTDQLGDLAATLAARGITGVTGRFLAWDGALPHIDRIAADQPVQVGYNPAISGLNLNFNRVHFEWKRGGNGVWGTTMDARGERFAPPVRMARMAVVKRDAPVFTYRAAGVAEEWTVASGALGKGGSRWLPVRLPGHYAAEVFQTLARAAGITLPDPQPVNALPVGQQLAWVNSVPLPDMLRNMLKYSTNLTAEVVGLRASGAGGLGASGAAMSAWVQATYGVKNSHVDHSGLGSASRVTAMGMARIFVAARQAKAGLQPILRSVGMRDAGGKMIDGHPVQVMAKSGTLNFVSGLAGHILPPQGRELVFAIFAADVPRRDALREEMRESPPGGRAWNRRARTLQGQLITNWVAAYG
jgi:D-alanyl-D-alanine carboxypeptidase/D-alanyl-D-alanine-endopeptidase (penicillin-binding protein 4)